jgi:chorismate mutase
MRIKLLLSILFLPIVSTFMISNKMIFILRKKIDFIDDRIIDLIDFRLKVCKEIGYYKTSNITVLTREENILNRDQISSYFSPFALRVINSL